MLEVYNFFFKKIFLHEDSMRVLLIRRFCRDYKDLIVILQNIC